MSNYKEKYDDTPESSFDLMPAGEYVVQVENATVSPSKKSGMDTWCLFLKVVEGRHIGRKLWLHISMKGEAKGVRRGALNALGLETQHSENIDLIDDVLDRKAIAIVFHDTYEGEKKEKVKRLKHLAVGKPVKQEAEELVDPSIPF